MRVQCIDLPPDSAPAGGLPTTATEQSISHRCLWFKRRTPDSLNADNLRKQWRFEVGFDRLENMFFNATNVPIKNSMNSNPSLSSVLSESRGPPIQTVLVDDSNFLVCIIIFMLLVFRIFENNKNWTHKNRARSNRVVVFTITIAVARVLNRAS